MSAHAIPETRELQEVRPVILHWANDERDAKRDYSLDMCYQALEQLGDSLQNAPLDTELLFAVRALKSVPELADQAKDCLRKNFSAHLFRWVNETQPTTAARLLISGFGDFLEIDLKTVREKRELVAIKAEAVFIAKGRRMNLSGFDIDTLFPLWEELADVSIVELTGNRIKALPADMLQLISIRQLILSYNQLSELPNGCTTLSRLNVLDLSNNKLTTLPNMAPMLSLKVLDLTANKLGATDGTSPTAIEALIHLVRLDLGNNKLKRLSEGFASSLTKLQSLSLFRNDLTTLPEDIGNLTGLTHLDLCFNGQLKGPPASCDNLFRLNDFRYVWTRISGETQRRLATVWREKLAAHAAAHQSTSDDDGWVAPPDRDRKYYEKGELTVFKKTGLH